MTRAIEVASEPYDFRASRQSAPAWLVILAWCLAAAALAHAVYVLVAWLHIPILDQHGFRQTQTALTTYWLMHGGPLFAYETPVVGSPWSVPFEFPFYQGLVALLAMTHVPLDVAGRLVSFAFLLGSLWPLRMLWRNVRLPPAGLPIMFALLLASPEYSFWSRTFLMESTAWCLALLWLALFTRFLDNPRSLTALWAIVIGLLAVLTKATTFPAFVLIGGLIFLPRCWRWLRAGFPRAQFPSLALATAMMLLPLAGGVVWVIFSDMVKMGNPIGRMLTSDGLKTWNYGTLAQRESAMLWQTTLQGRALPDIFGAAWGPALVALAGAFCRRRDAAAMLVLIVAFLTPFLLFTNLHIVHNYYQYANAAFIVAALAVALGSLAAQDRAPVLAAAIFIVVLVAQASHFQDLQRGWLSADTLQYPPYRIALIARDKLPQDGSLIVFGDDWSSTVPYYSRRKAMALPPWTPPALLEDVLRDPQSHLAGTQFSGVVDCGPSSQYGPAEGPLVDAFLAGRAVVAEYGTCRLLAAQR